MTTFILGVTSQRNAIQYRKELLNQFIPQPNKRKAYTSRDLIIEHRGAGDDLYADEHGDSLYFDDYEETSENEPEQEEDDSDDDNKKKEKNQQKINDDIIDLENCRVVTDKQLTKFFEVALQKCVNKKDLTMVRMSQAIHFFALGSVSDLIKGRDIMKTVRKEDKHCKAFQQHDTRIEFISKWMKNCPHVLKLKVHFDLVHIHHICALRDWHCYRRYDLAKIHFEKAGK